MQDTPNSYLEVERRDFSTGQMGVWLGQERGERGSVSRVVTEHCFSLGILIRFETSVGVSLLFASRYGFGLSRIVRN